MKVVKPPESLDRCTGVKIFLAGSIEMGKAEKWRDRIVDKIKDLDVCILNPRRDNWDSSWEQSINNPHFREQVEWELTAQEDADIIVMYLQPRTKSPISLLELGLFARSGKMIVYCPEGFWRKGNVDIVAKRYGIKTVDSFDELVEEVRRKVHAVSHTVPLPKWVGGRDILTIFGTKPRFHKHRWKDIKVEAGRTYCADREFVSYSTIYRVCTVCGLIITRSPTAWAEDEWVEVSEETQYALGKAGVIDHGDFFEVRRDIYENLCSYKRR